VIDILRAHADPKPRAAALPLESLRGRPQVLPRLLRAVGARGRPRDAARADVLPQLVAAAARGRQLVPARAAGPVRRGAEVHREDTVAAPTASSTSTSVRPPPRARNRPPAT
jgi:hypothetical protein